MASPTPLPFAAFLEVLRAKGYGIGLNDYAAMANLLAHWDVLKESELGDALAALIGRSDEEVDGIRRLFEEMYAPPPPPLPPPPPPEIDRFVFLRRHAWSLALLSAAVILMIAGFTIFPRPPIPSNLSPSVVPPPVDQRGGAVDTFIPPPPAPDLPPPPQRVERRPAAETIGGGFLVALAFFWSLKLRDTARVMARNAWSAARALVPGPYHFTEVVQEGSTRLPKSDVEDAATLLGRVFSKTAQARELDVRRSLRATLRRGLMPTLITKPRRVAETVLVFQDISQEMRLWEAKVEAFLSDLRRQGIALQRMYFDGDVTRLSDRPHRPAKPLDTVLRNRAGSPIMIVSSGSGLAALFESGEPVLLRPLGREPRTTWLTPVTDVRLWPPEFGRLPMAVWPMSRLGLTNAAHQLAGAGGDAGPDMRVRMAAEGRVTLADIERLKRLASLVPHPSPELLNLLRLRFAPDISDAAVLHLMLQADGASAPIIRLKEDDLRRSVNAVRRENPDLEAAARQTILEVLGNSEPVAGSAAHERWSIAVEVQRLLLADLQGATAHAVESREALRRFGEGPLWQEVRDALTIVPATPTMTAHVSSLGPKDGQAPAPPQDQATLAGVMRAPWSWPGLREMVPATLAAGLLLAGAVSLHALPSRPIEHRKNAYTLAYAATPSASTPQLSLAPAQRDDGLPRLVDLYQDKVVFRSAIQLADAAPTVVRLTAADTGHYYQVRATLPQQNLAVSEAVWVNSDRLAFVLLDASPWANVTITGGGTTTAAQQTPFTAALLPGTYQVHFENPNLTPPSTLDRVITVPAPDTAVHVVMPGFDAARTVDNLLQSAGQPAAAR